MATLIMVVPEQRIVIGEDVDAEWFDASDSYDVEDAYEIPILNALTAIETYFDLEDE